MGYLHDQATALDIGSGIGTYALTFADHRASVNALDMDAASLSVLEQRAIQSRHSNI
jgi:2-polyprenyl-3-methyl-5-hydroxy-6-metoxy-1,4-benzoquinol methylase